MKQKRRTPPRRRYVYLMERVTNRTLKTILLGRREIKIGVGVRPKKRRSEVDRGIPGKVILLDQYKVNNAIRIETKLHHYFKDYNFTVRGAKVGAGGTEFFRLTTRQYNEAKKILSGEMKFQESNYTFPFFKIVIIPTTIVILIHKWQTIIELFF